MAEIFKIYNQQQLVKMHRDTIFNKKKLKKRNHICGCFSCLETFDSSDVVETCDNGQTALCPNCGIDSVLSETRTLKITDSLLSQMYNRYFAHKEEYIDYDL